MEILKGVEIIDLALYLKKEKTLILADFHTGLEEDLNKQGYMIPVFQQKDIEERLEKILKKVKPKLIIINGDLKHEFGTISQTEWKNTLKILDILSKKAKVILIKGNHDKVLDPIAKKRDVEIKDYYKINDIYICHGHKIPKDIEFSTSKTLIIAHDHPAISIGTSIRKETYKCFLLGKFKDKKLIVQPSFNLVREGTNVIKGKLLSPFLKQDLSNFEVFIVQDKIYKFGKIKNLV